MSPVSSVVHLVGICFATCRSQYQAKPIVNEIIKKRLLHDLNRARVRAKEHAGMEGIEQRDNIAIACPERAFLDMMYLSAGNCYFDNLRPLSKKRIRELLPFYRSAKLNERVKEELVRVKG